MDDRIQLELSPVPASWDKAGSPGQIRLTEFLDSTERQLDPVIRQIAGPLSLSLDVGLHSGDLLRDRDLDNFLFPLVMRLGAQRFREVRGRKGRGATSFVTVGRSTADVDAGQGYVITTSAPGDSVEFKRQVCSSLENLAVREVADGPVKMTLDFVVGGNRIWPNLWKATIDACGPLLGRASDNRPWHPQDGRIVDLILRVETDQLIGHAVRVTIHAEPVKN